MQNIVRNSEILGPDIQNVSALIAENDRYDHQCFLSVVELLKLRARVMVSEREEVEELDRCVRMYLRAICVYEALSTLVDSKAHVSSHQY